MLTKALQNTKIQITPAYANVLQSVSGGTANVLIVQGQLNGKAELTDSEFRIWLNNSDNK